MDVYSQGKEPLKPLPKGVSARNMGKNDIWIAATAAISYSTLITTDNDFEHLENVFINLIELKRY
jgi:predicted nucleic acid-binding protein